MLNFYQTLIIFLVCEVFFIITASHLIEVMPDLTGAISTVTILASIAFAIELFSPLLKTEEDYE